MAENPLIVTLALDESSHGYFTQLRNRYFPKHCNYLEAHLTLFHHLPANEPLIDEVIKKFSARKSFDAEVTGIQNIGNGNAFAVASETLQEMHKKMQEAFSPYLISQDRQRLWPHITVQNKVTAFKAKQTTEILSADFNKMKVTATGIDTWLYLKGPWEKKQSFPFVDANG